MHIPTPTPTYIHQHVVGRRIYKHVAMILTTGTILCGKTLVTTSVYYHVYVKHVSVPYKYYTTFYPPLPCKLEINATIYFKLLVARKYHSQFVQIMLTLVFLLFMPQLITAKTRTGGK